MSQPTPAPTWAPVPTAPRPQLKKPFYKRWWFIAIVSIVVIAAIGQALEEGKTSSSKNASQTQSASQSQNVPGAEAAPQDQSASQTQNAPEAEAAPQDQSAPEANAAPPTQSVPETAAPATVPTPEAEPKVPREYQNALESAKSYSNVMHMSKKGIYNQLISPYADKFPAEAAQYAVDNLQADYNANALAKAKEYQETMHMSSRAIRDQLTSEYGEKFTASEADYAVAHLND